MNKQDIRDNYKAQLDEAINAALENFSPDKALEIATRDLANARKHAVWNLLGLTDKWGKWEYDSDRKDSPMSRWMTAEISEQLGEFCQKLIADELASVRASMRNRIKKLLKEELEGRIDWEIRSVVRSRAQKLTEDLIKEVTTELHKELQ